LLEALVDAVEAPAGALRAVCALLEEADVDVPNAASAALDVDDSAGAPHPGFASGGFNDRNGYAWMPLARRVDLDRLFHLMLLESRGLGQQPQPQPR
jgi:hypothetical protein